MNEPEKQGSFFLPGALLRMKFRNMRVHVQVGDLTDNLETDWLTPLPALARVMAFYEQRSTWHSLREKMCVWARPRVCVALIIWLSWQLLGKTHGAKG